jgi:aspartyl aminopeptidase
MPRWASAGWKSWKSSKYKHKIHTGRAYACPNEGVEMPETKKTKAKNPLVYERKNFWQTAAKPLQKEAFTFAENYKSFLNKAKTERETIRYTLDVLKKNLFNSLEGKKSGKKVYRVFRSKTMAIAVIGKESVSKGVNMVAAHIDAPRVDLKQNPLYEDNNTNLAVMRTHYYGGIKKYQWVSTPLALHGFVVKADGKTVDISIGDDLSDPVFVIPDLLPHLARKEQYTKTLGEAIDAGKMNLVFSSMMQFNSEEKEAAKLYALKLLHDKYGIKEHDLISAELELVPAAFARDGGMDKSMVVGYGQDDRICAYSGLQAILSAVTEQPQRTMVVYLSDKEEIGSAGNTGAHSIFIYDFIADLLKSNGEDNGSANLRKTFINSRIISGDVTAAMDPNYPNVYEKQNAALFNYGVSLSKFTGSGGKYGSNDANSEFTAQVIRTLNKAGIYWQMVELGKVDEGGGGTIAHILAQSGAEVIDCGTGLMGMHSLYEICSKADLFETYRAYKALLLAE